MRDSALTRDEVEIVGGSEKEREIEGHEWMRCGGRVMSLPCIH
jgi:hypothetical protein